MDHLGLDPGIAVMGDGAYLLVDHRIQFQCLLACLLPLRSLDHQDQNEENESSELRKMGGHLESHLQYLGPDGK